MYHARTRLAITRHWTRPVHWSARLGSAALLRGRPVAIWQRPARPAVPVDVLRDARWESCLGRRSHPLHHLI
jgi:hypothetical protein